MIDGNTCTGPLAGGASGTIMVHFSPAATGDRAATLTVSSSPGTISTVGLDGTGIATALAVSGTTVVPPPDLAPTMTVASQNFNGATVTITVANLGAASSAAATMTVEVDPTQSFSYEAGAGSDCTASFVNGDDSVFTCPVPVIAPGGTYTRQLTISNLSGQTPHYLQTSATTVMPGDTNSANNTGYAFVTLD